MLEHDQTRAALTQLLGERLMVIDGAMGTMVQALRLEEADFRGSRFATYDRDLKGNNDLLVLTRPDVIRDIHDEYLDAGADLVSTDTFNGTAISQADYGTQDLVYEINREAADVAGLRVSSRPLRLAKLVTGD